MGRAARQQRQGTGLLAGAAALALLAGCGDLDSDLRGLAGGFNTTAALQNLPDRPRPDSRGIISYPNYQVVVAQRGDTVGTIASRLGFDAAELAGYNGIAPDVALRRDEIIALPRRVAEPSPATGAATTGPILPAGADAVQTTTLEPAAAPTAPVRNVQTGDEPIRHKVEAGETAYIISRRYDVPVSLISDWNGLDANLTIREGQYLLIPQGSSLPPGAAATPEPQQAPSQPGTGSATPVPPSAAQPLPAEQPAPASAAPAPAPVQAPDLGATQSATPVSNAPFVRPVQGSIIRDYAPGRNEGIDISAAAGTQVKAAASGTVAAVTTDTAGITIVVIRHASNIFTIYTHIGELTVQRGTQVSQGQVIGKVAAGSPSYLHFEVRSGTDSVDPNDYLP